MKSLAATTVVFSNGEIVGNNTFRLPKTIDGRQFRDSGNVINIIRVSGFFIFFFHVNIYMEGFFWGRGGGDCSFKNTFFFFVFVANKSNV